MPVDVGMPRHAGSAKPDNSQSVPGQLRESVLVALEQQHQRVLRRGMIPVTRRSMLPALRQVATLGAPTINILRLKRQCRANTAH